MSALIQRDGETQNDGQLSSRFSFTGSEETLNGLYRTPATTPTSTKCTRSSSECTTPSSNNSDLFSSAVPLNLQKKVSSKGRTVTRIVSHLQVSPDLPKVHHLRRQQEESTLYRRKDKPRSGTSYARLP